MRLARSVLVSIFLASSVVSACSSTADEAEPSAMDAGADTLVPPPPPPEDASTHDVARPGVRPSSRREVVCAHDPCYLAVSGSGGEHVCGLLKDGTVRCWGRDTRLRAETLPDGGQIPADGALGRGRAVSTLEGATPAPVAGLTGVTQISVGQNLGTCARTGDGSVYCWGRNEFGQLGRLAEQARLPVPTRVEGLPPVSAVALGASTGCAIASADSALYCWGARNSRIGLAAAAGTSVAFPPQVMTGFRPPVHELALATSARDSFTPYQDTIVTLLDGGLLTSLGELPAGDTSVTPPFSPLPFEVHGVARVGVFGYLTTDGLLSRWAPDDRFLYVPMASLVVDVVLTVGRTTANSAYVAQAGVLLSDGRLFRWGRNVAGTLGYPTNAIDLAEEPLDMTHVASDRVVSFAMTLGSTCVSLVDGSVKCWGANQRGELGRGTIDAADHPEAELIR